MTATAVDELAATARLDPLVMMKRDMPNAVPARYAPFHRQLATLPAPGESQARVVYRGAAKTTLTRGLMLYWARHRYVKGILIVRAGGADGKADRDSLEGLAFECGLAFTRNEQTELVVINDVPIWFRTPRTRTRGIQWTSSTGEIVRPELILFDDLEDDDTAKSQTQTDRLERFMFNVAIGTASQQYPPRVIMLGTPLSPISLVAKAMRKEPPFDVWTDPLVVPIVDSEGVPAWPDNFDSSIMPDADGKPGRVPLMTYHQEFMLDPLPPGTLMFPPELTRWRSIGPGRSDVVVAVDPAGDGPDATAATAITLLPAGLHVVDVLHWTGSDVDAPLQVVSFVRNVEAAGWKVRGVSVEGVGAWKFFKREVGNGLFPMTVTSDVPSESKTARALPLTLWHGRGNLTVSEHLQGTPWDREFHSFTAEGFTVTGHDDCVDSTTWAGQIATSNWTLQPLAPAAQTV